MTSKEYSIFGLKELLSDLELLSTSIATFPRDAVDKSLYERLIEEQYNLILSINAYSLHL